MHKLLRACILITFGMLIIGIIGGCTEEVPPEYGGINLVAIIPEEGATISATEEIRMVFDSFPKSVTVDGKEATVLDNIAIVQVADLINARTGTKKTFIISWTNLDNSFVGTQTVTFDVLKPPTTVEVDPAPGGSYIPSNTEFTLTFSDEVVAVWLNDTPAVGSGLNWKASPYLPLGTLFLIVRWVNQDASVDTMDVGIYNVFDNGGAPPEITSGTVIDGEVDVDPAVMNAGGFRFDFDEPVVGNIILTDEAGGDLRWQASVAGQTATLTAVAGRELVNGTTYKIEIDVQDGAGNQTRMTITFVTKPK